MDLLDKTINFESGNPTYREVLDYFSELIRRKKHLEQRYYYHGIIYKMIDYGIFDENGNINYTKFWEYEKG